MVSCLALPYNHTYVQKPKATVCCSLSSVWPCYFFVLKLLNKSFKYLVSKSLLLSKWHIMWSDKQIFSEYNKNLNVTKCMKHENRSHLKVLMHLNWPVSWFKQAYKNLSTFAEFCRWFAYTQFVYRVQGKLGRGNRKITPACVVNEIHKTFPSADGIYAGVKVIPQFCTAHPVLRIITCNKI